MGLLTNSQVEEINNYLQNQGISFEPLRSELLDHLISDVELRMEDGINFNLVWQHIKREIPQNHLTKLEIETMYESLKKAGIIFNSMANFPLSPGLKCL